MKRPILVSLAAVILSLGLLGSTPAQALASHPPATAATMNPANDPPDLIEFVVVLLDRVTDVLFRDRDGDDDDHDRDHDGDHDRDDDGHRRSRCSGVISVCLG